MANIRNNIGTPAPAGPGESAQAVRERWAGEIGPAATYARYNVERSMGGSAGCPTHGAAARRSLC